MPKQPLQRQEIDIKRLPQMSGGCIKN